MYVCGETGRTRIREWASSDKDSWSDFIRKDLKPFTTGLEAVYRFNYVGPST